MQCFEVTSDLHPKTGHPVNVTVPRQPNQKSLTDATLLSRKKKDVRCTESHRNLRVLGQNLQEPHLPSADRQIDIRGQLTSSPNLREKREAGFFFLKNKNGKVKLVEVSEIISSSVSEYLF